MCPTVHAFLLTGSNAGSGAYVETNYTAVAPTPAGAPFWQVSGDWIYESQNSSPLYDPSGYFINGASYQLTENEGPLLQEGRFAFRLRKATYSAGTSTPSTISAAARSRISELRLPRFRCPPAAFYCLGASPA